MFKLRAHQQEFFDLVVNAPYQGMVAFHRMGLGKAQPLSSTVYTPNGPTKMGDLKVGDEVFGLDGKPKKVLQIHPQGLKTVFKVTFSDGASTLCCDEHLWSVRTPKEKHSGKGFTVRELKEIRGKLTDKWGNKLHQIPITECVEFAPRKVPLPPYTLGVLIGDGSLTHTAVSFTNASDYIFDRVKQELQDFPGVRVNVRRSWQEGDNSYRVGLSQVSRSEGNKVREALNLMGLNTTSHYKHVPDDYKYNTAEVRILILNGLLDTDGYVAKDGTVQYTSASKKLVEDVNEIVQSLGGVGTLKHKITNFGTDAWTTTLKIPAWLLSRVITKPEKAARVRPLSKYQPSRGIASVEEVGMLECQCISVEGEHYLTDSFIVTHNTLTTLALAQRYLAEAKKQGLTSPKFIIFCPKSAVHTWHSECMKWTPHIKRDMIVYPYSQMHSAISRVSNSVYPYVFLGLDECHYLKTPDTKRIKDFARFLNALGTTRHGYHGKIMPMTGTPVPNNAAEIYTMWALCTAPNVVEAAIRMTDMKSFELWRNSFTNRKDVTYKRKVTTPGGGTGFTYGSATSYEGVAEVDRFSQLIAPIIHYKRVEDCIDLPPKQDTFIDLDLPDDKLLKDANIETPDAYMSLLERISRAKTPYMTEWVNEFLALGEEQLVVFSLFTAPLRILAQRFPKHVRLITGKESGAERAKTIEDFQNKRIRVVAMSYKAGSESLNFQQARNTFYLNFPWNEDTLEQAKARTWRSGQTETTNHYFMLSGENDRRCYDRVLMKKAANDQIKERLLNNSLVGKEVKNIFENFIENAEEFGDLEGLI